VEPRLGEPAWVLLLERLRVTDDMAKKTKTHTMPDGTKMSGSMPLPKSKGKGKGKGCK
jgi:hypothetical protein